MEQLLSDNGIERLNNTFSDKIDTVAMQGDAEIGFQYFLHNNTIHTVLVTPETTPEEILVQIAEETEQGKGFSVDDFVKTEKHLSSAFLQELAEKFPDNETIKAAVAQAVIREQPVADKSNSEEEKATMVLLKDFQHTEFSEKLINGSYDDASTNFANTIAETVDRALNFLQEQGTLTDGIVSLTKSDKGYVSFKEQGNGNARAYLNFIADFSEREVFLDDKTGENAVNYSRGEFSGKGKLYMDLVADTIRDVMELERLASTLEHMQKQGIDLGDIGTYREAIYHNLFVAEGGKEKLDDVYHHLEVLTKPLSDSKESPANSPANVLGLAVLADGLCDTIKATASRYVEIAEDIRSKAEKAAEAAEQTQGTTAEQPITDKSITEKEKPTMAQFNSDWKKSQTQPEQTQTAPAQAEPVAETQEEDRAYITKATADLVKDNPKLEMMAKAGLAKAKEFMEAIHEAGGDIQCTTQKGHQYEAKAAVTVTPAYEMTEDGKKPALDRNGEQKYNLSATIKDSDGGSISVGMTPPKRSNEVPQITWMTASYTTYEKGEKPQRFKESEIPDSPLSDAMKSAAAVIRDNENTPVRDFAKDIAAHFKNIDSADSKTVRDDEGNEHGVSSVEYSKHSYEKDGETHTSETLSLRDHTVDNVEIRLTLTDEGRASAQLVEWQGAGNPPETKFINTSKDMIDVTEQFGLDDKIGDATMGFKDEFGGQGRDAEKTAEQPKQKKESVEYGD